MVKLLKRLLNFSGRSTRLEFWTGYALSFLGEIILEFLFNPYHLDIYLYSWIFYHSIIILPLLALLIRRLHDINISGWYILIIISINLTCFIVKFPTENEQFLMKSIYVITDIWFLYWLCKKGDVDTNQYG